MLLCRLPPLPLKSAGLLVDDAAAAYEASVANGATAVRPPTLLREEPDGGSSSAAAVVSEVGLYGDVVLRYVSGQWQVRVCVSGEARRANPWTLRLKLAAEEGGRAARSLTRCAPGCCLCTWQAPFLPGYASTPDEPAICYGLQRLDHAVGNVHKLVEALEHIMGFTGVWLCLGWGFVASTVGADWAAVLEGWVLSLLSPERLLAAPRTGFHEFAEFVAEDVGTLDSGLNSMVLASNNELVLLPINEPTFGTKRKSQIQVRLVCGGVRL
jgi:4-hydroxyphenylpyruvate dioxygenase